MAIDPASPSPPSLRQHVYEVLRDRIVGLDYAPGQRLVERDLAIDLEVSRIPLREAMSRLQNEGLLVSVPRQGTIVAPFGPAEVRDLFDVRESLEVLAFRLAAERIDRPGLGRLRRDIAQATRAIARGDEAGSAAANSGFHRTVIDVAANPLLTSLMGPLGTRVQWLFQLTRVRDAQQQNAEHEALYDALAAHDPDRAATLAFDHVRSGREVSVRLAQTWGWTGIDPVTATRTRRR